MPTTPSKRSFVMNTHVTVEFEGVNERRTDVPPVFPHTAVLHLILTVSHRIASWQELRLSMEVVFWPRLSTEVVGGIEGVPNGGAAKIVGVSRHDDYARVMK